MPELKALARERRLKGYSRLRKSELIAFLQDNKHQAQRLQRPLRNGASTATPTDVFLGAKSTSTDVYLGTEM